MRLKKIYKKLLGNIASERIVDEYQVETITGGIDTLNIDNQSTLLQKDISLAGHYRPSPVKFTNEQPVQFPLKPKPERVPVGTKSFDTREQFPGNTEKDVILSENSEPVRPILSMETLQNFTDFGKEEVKISDQYFLGPSFICVKNYLDFI